MSEELIDINEEITQLGIPIAKVEPASFTDYKKKYEELVEKYVKQSQKYSDLADKYVDLSDKYHENQKELFASGAK